MAAKDFRGIFRALDEQGWRQVEYMGNHFKLYPPDKSAAMVSVAVTSGDPRAFDNVLRDLRRSGFVWPWPAKQPRTESGLQTRQETPMAELRSLFPDAPFETSVPETATPASPPSMDDLFRTLKEARNYAALAREARDDAQRERDRAEAALAGSERELELAVEQLKSAKAEFDRAFSAEGA